MSLRAVHTFEGLADGVPVTTASQGGTLSGAAFALVNTPGGASFTTRAAAAFLGSVGVRMVTTDTDAGTLQFALSAGVTKVACALPLRPSGDTTRTTTAQVIQLRTSAGNGVIVVVTTTGKMAVQNRSGVTQKQFTTDYRTLTYPVFHVYADRGSAPDGTNGILNAALYDGNTLVESMTALTNVDMRTEAAWAFIQMGKLNSGTGTALIADLDTPTYEEGGTGLLGGTLNETIANARPVTSLSSPSSIFEPGATVTVNAATSDAEGDTITGYTWRIVSTSGGLATPTLVGSGASRTLVLPASLAGGNVVVGCASSDAGGAGAEATLTLPVLGTTEQAAGAGPAAVPAVLWVAS